MKEEWLNRRVKIENVPASTLYLVGQTGRICHIGGYDIKPDDIAVKLDNDGPIGFFKIHQLSFI